MSVLLMLLLPVFIFFVGMWAGWQARVRYEKSKYDLSRPTESPK